ncbi:conserved protein of unknown function [Nitrospina watsonii]|uniref:Uncharacterized protein n=1 Tax=Nitrospina watsonii TaxID=1323948 RepID=A0ABM9HEZ2_9BACT|nr:conserved protein of unknown function [Nitrospina watsonii]
MNARSPKPLWDKTFWAKPLTLAESLKVRDGLASQGSQQVPQPVLQVIQTHMNRNRFRGICLN